MARRSLSTTVLESADRAHRILSGLWALSDGAERELLAQAMHELNLINIACHRGIKAADAAPKSPSTTDTPLGTAFAGDKLSKATRARTTRKAAPGAAS